MRALRGSADVHGSDRGSNLGNEAEGLHRILSGYICQSSGGGAPDVLEDCDLCGTGSSSPLRQCLARLTKGVVAKRTEFSLAHDAIE